MAQVINLSEKFELLEELWSPKIVAEFNDSYLKIVKVKGEFVWHHHEDEDELFLVVKGRLTIKLQGREVALKEGELAVIPKGTEHKPISEGETLLILLEPKTTVNTGNLRNEKTRADSWI